MITKGLKKAVRHSVEDTFHTGRLCQSGNMDATGQVEMRTDEMMALIKAEAINLADKIIGKDIILHGNGSNLDPTDKAVFDFQVNQRLILAEYQNAPYKKIPTFANEDEEREFWQTHDSTEYIDWSKAEHIDKPTGPDDLINPDLSENEG